MTFNSIKPAFHSGRITNVGVRNYAVARRAAAIPRCGAKIIAGSDSDLPRIRRPNPNTASATVDCRPHVVATADTSMDDVHTFPQPRFDKRRDLAGVCLLRGAAGSCSKVRTNSTGLPLMT